jgi:hypothetical protein
MWRALGAIGFLIFGWVNCASAESVYLTTTAPIPGAGFGSSSSGYTFIAPYFARVRTNILVSITGASKTGEGAGTPATLSITVTPLPVTRAYLYLIRNAFFADTIDVGVGTDGMLSTSSSTSVQEITAILNELATTAATVFAHTESGQQNPPTPTPRDQCFTAVASYVSSGPLYLEHSFEQISKWGYAWRRTIQASNPSVDLQVRVAPTMSPGRQVELDEYQPGLVAFFPVPASLEVACVVNSDLKHPILVTAPQTANLYTESHFLDPQRGFLSGPTDAYTFSEGFLTEHKYTDQSPAKTIVDTVTGPIQAIMPSVAVTQSTQVQGTSTTTKNGTTTKTAAPKGQ